jgi:hypothetical protein
VLQKPLHQGNIIATPICKIQAFYEIFPFFFAFGMLYYLKMHFQKGAAADGRTERKETGA